jgi:hypothetical protein
LRGLCGFGANRVFHSQRLLDLSADLPLIVEVVETREKIDAIMPRIDAMMGGGMITLEKATVIRYTRHRSGKQDGGKKLPAQQKKAQQLIPTSPAPASILNRFFCCSYPKRILSRQIRISKAREALFKSRCTSGSLSARSPSPPST